MPCRGDTPTRRNQDVRPGALNGIAFGNVAGQPLTAKVETVEFKVVKAGSWVVAFLIAVHDACILASLLLS